MGDRTLSLHIIRELSVAPRTTISLTVMRKVGSQHENDRQPSRIGSCTVPGGS